jgi:divalent metal cation (Fe/Co/Zn/Cd) transporter
VTDIVVHVEPEWDLIDSQIGASVRRVLSRFPAEAHEICVVEADHTEVSLHLELDPDLTLSEAHDIASDLEAAVLSEVDGIDRIVTHLEPREPSQPAEPIVTGRDYETLVADAAERIEGLSTAHDVVAVRVRGGVRLSAHVCTEGDLALEDAHLRVEQMESAIRAQAPELERVTIHVEPGATGNAPVS